MATYKVIQDIEADDKIVGPFGIRQFVYLLIVAVLAYIGYRASELAWFLGLPFLPFIIFFGLLALPFGGSQPTEVWLLAKFRFALKPKKHVWSQDGVKELVTVTVPKRIEKHLTKEFSQTEVRSRLETLASTIDSRGWAIKHVNASMFGQPALATAGGSERLVDVGALTGQAPTSDVTASDDVFDEQNNAVAQNLGRMVSASSKARRDQLVAQMKQGSFKAGPSLSPTPSNASPPPPTPPKDKASVLPPAQSSPAGLASFSGTVVRPDPSATKPSTPTTPSKPTEPLTEEELLEKLHAEAAKKPKNYGHLHVVKTLKQQEEEAAAKAKAEQAKAAANPVTPPPDPDIIQLANNDDLNVETIARQAKKKKDKDQSAPGEVVIKLH